jgi:hypothetical protein
LSGVEKSLPEKWGGLKCGLNKAHDKLVRLEWEWIQKKHVRGIHWVFKSTRKNDGVEGYVCIPEGSAEDHTQQMLSHTTTPCAPKLKYKRTGRIKENDWSCVLKSAASALSYLGYDRLAFNLCNGLGHGVQFNLYYIALLRQRKSEYSVETRQRKSVYSVETRRRKSEYIVETRRRKCQCCVETRRRKGEYCLETRRRKGEYGFETRRRKSKYSLRTRSRKASTVLKQDEEKASTVLKQEAEKASTVWSNFKAKVQGYCTTTTHKARDFWASVSSSEKTTDEATIATTATLAPSSSTVMTTTSGTSSTAPKKHHHDVADDSG